MNISFLSFGVPDETALFLIRIFEFEYRNEKIPSRKCFPQIGPYMARIQILSGSNVDTGHPVENQRKKIITMI